MTIFSRFFGTAQTRQIKKLLVESEERTKREYGPIAAIGTGIIEASTRCRDRIRPMISADSDKDRQECEIFAFYEFLYFFMHMSNRAGASCLIEAQISKVQSYLGPLVSSVAIDSYFAHWPPDLKEKMTREFYEKLNAAELEYTDATRAESQLSHSPVPLENLFMTLGSNIAGLAVDNLQDQTVITVVSEFAFSEWADLRLPERMLEVKAANPAPHSAPA